MAWTRFMDMYSGGSRKTDYEEIYIELEEEKAVEYFECKFGESPYNITCDCCGEDFSVYETCEIPFDTKDDKILLIKKENL